MTTIERTDLSAADLTVATDLGLTAIDVWMVDAGCRDLDTSLFFSDELDDIAEAKRACLACPVRTRCLDAAVERGEQYGVWGGHLFVAGRIVLSKRRRGRPPKNPRPGDTLPEVEVPEVYRPLVAAGV
jgi:WhiB family redox-sensing transcriptional regulator